MKSENLIGQTLDGKYKVESEIGRGGMGTVYLSTHVGTERPVAVKVISPQFMAKTEFVERFRREARAAGRLRHPNVVDVTDFGFSETDQGRVAYLVMEYLDGCTLGEILDEEKKLPLEWSLEILEQVCSAVQEAHKQGIIHRDLKPDNIWLEPDGRGGYTVKVLDFGIAKLENDVSPEIDFSVVAQLENASKGRETQLIQQDKTISENANSQTVHDRKENTALFDRETLIENQPSNASAEAGTIIQPAAEVNSEGGTAIFPDQKTKILEDDALGTKILSAEIETNGNAAAKTTSQLTRVGAVLGTPLYMSPEQCRGEKLTAASDIYSLGVIAYQMISGQPPFNGDFTQVMESHKHEMPPFIKTKNIPVNVKKVIFSALEKDPSARPQSASAFASKLRSQSQSVWSLMSKALVVYSENFVKFILLAIIIYLPMELFFIGHTTLKILSVSKVIAPIPILDGGLSLIFMLLSFFSGTILTGIITWLVAQKMAFPMRPLKIRPAFKALRRRLKSLLGTAALSSIGGFFGLALCLIPGLIAFVCWALVTPVVMMEGLSGRKAFARSYQLVRRNLRTTIGILLTAFFLAGAVGLVSGVFSQGLLGNYLQTNSAKAEKASSDVSIQIGQGIKITEKESADDSASESAETEAVKSERKVKNTIRETAFAAIQLPLSTLIGSFIAVVLALLYIKTRMAGGETMSDLLEQFEETDQPRKKWQERVRGRLLQSGRITSRNNT